MAANLPSRTDLVVASGRKSMLLADWVAARPDRPRRGSGPACGVGLLPLPRHRQPGCAGPPRPASPQTDRDTLPNGRDPDPLTDAEIRVLEKLPQRLSYADIAAELHLSLNTVKTHLRHSYMKLGVSSRSTAVRRAASLGFL